MRIDPRAFTFDANERPVLCAALRQFIKRGDERLARLSARRQTEKVRDELYEVSSDKARAEDLIARLSAPFPKLIPPSREPVIPLPPRR